MGCVWKSRSHSPRGSSEACNRSTPEGPGNRKHTKIFIPSPRIDHTTYSSHALSLCSQTPRQLHTPASWYYYLCAGYALISCCFGWSCQVKRIKCTVKCEQQLVYYWLYTHLFHPDVCGHHLVLFILCSQTDMVLLNHISYHIAKLSQDQTLRCCHLPPTQGGNTNKRMNNW